MQSVFSVSRPYFSLQIEGREYTFYEGKYHNQLTLHNEADIQALRAWAADHSSFVEIYHFTEQVIDDESDLMSEWDRYLISRMVRR